MVRRPAEGTEQSINRIERITCVLKKSPVPDTTGSRRRHLRLLETLTDEFSTRLIILGRVDSAERSALAERGFAVDVPSLLRRQPKAMQRARWLAGQGSAHDYLGVDTPSLRAEVESLVSAHGAEAVWCSGAALASMLALPARRHTIVDVPHVESARIRRELRIGLTSFRGSPAQAKRLALLAADARSRITRESAVLARTDLATPVSDVELTLLAGRVAGRIEVIHNGVDLPESVSWMPGSRRLLFVGNLHYAPNLDAVTWLIRELLPAIRARIPDVELDVVGAGPRTLAELATGPGIRLHGFVESLDPLYRSAGVVVAPLRAGSGTKLKVLEAFAHGVPVVTTPIGIEGIPARHGTEVRVEADRRSISAAVVDLLEDVDAALAQSVAARARVESGYGWPAIGRRLVEAIRGLEDPEHRPRSAQR